MGSETNKPGLWERWKAFAIKIGTFQARLILTIFYYVLLAPFSLIVRMLDPLSIGSSEKSTWLLRGTGRGDPLDQARRQS